MRGRKRAWATLMLLLIGVALFGWAAWEARRQRREIEAALTAEAALLARSLGPGLSAATNAARELDEIILWKLLDNARLLAELFATGAASEDRLAEIAEANGLDTVVILDRIGRPVIDLGEAVELDFDQVASGVLDGRADEVILGVTVDEEIEHVGVVVAVPGGGAVLVRIEASTAKTFAQRLGVENLLRNLVGTGSVLYLSYRELPGPTLVEAAWDGGEVPPPTTAGTVRPVRDRSIFEVRLDVAAPAGREAELRVGLDGSSLAREAAGAARRTILVGILLAAFGLTATAFATVSRLRSIERQESTRRVAEAEAARRRSERLAAAGALTAGLAHEVRSPLNAISLAAQRLERRLDGQVEPQGMATHIRGEVVRLDGVLREFLELASPATEGREKTDLAELAGQVLELLEAEAESASVMFQEVEGEATCEVDARAIRRAMINLTRNAVQASPAGGRVDVVVGLLDGEVSIRVLDEGPGPGSELADRVFDPFVTGRAEGTGLGLALVRRVAEEHGGTAVLRPRESGGSEAEIRFPIEEGTEA